MEYAIRQSAAVCGSCAGGRGDAFFVQTEFSSGAVGGWDIRRIPDEEVGDIFAACDVVLVTYSAKFRSASGVLNAAVSARKPVLASSGSGPLKTVVEKYELGVFVKPDDFEEGLRGASKLVKISATGKCEFVLQPDWDKYEQENSWEENARWIYKAFEM